MRFERITVEPDQMGGVPCIRGPRVPVATVVGMVAKGMTADEILEVYSYLEGDRTPGQDEQVATYLDGVARRQIRGANPRLQV